MSEMACEACVYARGPHADWCPRLIYWRGIQAQMEKAMKAPLPPHLLKALLRK